MKILDSIMIGFGSVIVLWILVYSASSIAIREHSIDREEYISATSTTAIVQICDKVEIPLYNTSIAIKHEDIDAGGRFYGYGTDGPYVLTVDTVSIKTLAHEATHAMQAIVKSRNVIGIEEEAYLVGYITDELTKCFNIN